MYKGVVNVGSEIRASFSSDYSNKGTASLLIGHGRLGSDSEAKSTTVAPGGTGTVSLTVTAQGNFHVFVDVAEESDSGKLEVSEGAKIVDSESIKGDTKWLYSVV